MKPSYPTGHNQDVAFVVQWSDDGFDPKDWMQEIGNRSTGEFRIRDLIIPGTHDSGSYDIRYMSTIALDYSDRWTSILSDLGLTQGWAKTQSHSIYQQLCAGVRYLDLRVSNGIYVTEPIAGLPIHFKAPRIPFL